MNASDRAALIELLERLGDPDDPAALAAAREVHARMAQTGLAWEDLIPAAVAVSEPEQAAPPAPEAGEAALIDRLLARKDLGEATREELLELKTDLQSGELTALDREYLRALSARLRAG